MMLVERTPTSAPRRDGARVERDHPRDTADRQASASNDKPTHYPDLATHRI